MNGRIWTPLRNQLARCEVRVVWRLRWVKGMGFRDLGFRVGVTGGIHETQHEGLGLRSPY